MKPLFESGVHYTSAHRRLPTEHPQQGVLAKDLGLQLKAGTVGASSMAAVR